jgi:hypothetical protein
MQEWLKIEILVTARASGTIVEWRAIRRVGTKGEILARMRPEVGWPISCDIIVGNLERAQTSLAEPAQISFVVPIRSATCQGIACHGCTGAYRALKGLAG